MGCERTSEVRMAAPFMLTGDGERTDLIETLVRRSDELNEGCGKG
jgi:hypothetical protein